MPCKRLKQITWIVSTNKTSSIFKITPLPPPPQKKPQHKQTKMKPKQKPKKEKLAVSNFLLSSSRLGNYTGVWLI